MIFQEEKRAGAQTVAQALSEDDLFKEMTTRLQALTDAGAAPAEADLGSKSQQSVIIPNSGCEYGDEIQVLPDGAAVEEFLRSMADKEAKNFSKTRRWNAAAGSLDKKQEALLADTAARLDAIEARLERLENLLISQQVLVK